MRPLVFRPNEKEAIYLEDNEINWSAYCHNALDRDMNNKKYIMMDKFQLPLIMIIVGVLVLIIGISNIQFGYIVIACYVLSIASISFGVFSIIGGLKYGG